MILSAPLPRSTQTLPALVATDGDEERVGGGAGGEGAVGLEGAVGIAQQDDHVVAGSVGDDDVGSAVAVHVGYRHGIRVRAGAEGALGLEGAVAVAQEHAA